jgi:hypothetical protein
MRNLCKICKIAQAVRLYPQRFGWTDAAIGAKSAQRSKREAHAPSGARTGYET